MKAQFIDKILSTPWNIHKLRGRTILGHIVSTLLKNERPAEDKYGAPLPKMQILGDVAVIPIRGIVLIGVPDWIKAYGFSLTDANDIEEEVGRALAHPDVRLIVIDGDSPGGSALAGDKLFEVTRQADRRKPVLGWCGDGADLASTMYLAVASARAILAGPYAAGIGCIGTYLAYLDDTEFWEKMGIKFRVFRSGELKGMGIDGLSEHQADYLQSLVGRSGEAFRAAVRQFRTGIAEEDMEGQWFTGIEAAQRGFVAGNAKDLASAITKFRGMV